MKDKNILLNNGKVKGFTIADNRVLSATNLSFKAKGLYIYLISKPQRWNFSSVRIANETNDGRDGILSGLQELETVGLLKRRQLTDKSGKWLPVVYYLMNADGARLTQPVAGAEEKITSGKSVEDREADFKDRCRPIYEEKKDRMTIAMVRNFINYWTEKTYGGKRMRFETQNAFDISRRMETWIRNNKNFNSGFKSTRTLKQGMQTQNT